MERQRREVEREEERQKGEGWDRREKIEGKMSRARYRRREEDRWDWRDKGLGQRVERGETGGERAMRERDERRKVKKREQKEREREKQERVPREVTEKVREGRQQWSGGERVGEDTVVGGERNRSQALRRVRRKGGRETRCGRKEK